MKQKRHGSQKERLFLSVVVIGRNEAKRLPALFASLPGGEGIEWIYVDSCSEDDSVSIALEHGAKVFLVDENSVYAPATGRYIGTKEARGHWLLFLDGDMVLRREFCAFLDRLKMTEHLPADTAGFVGRTCNYYNDEKDKIVEVRDYVVLPEREMGPLESWGKPAGYHGGAVLYRRECVLDAGNWNPAVYQLEEVDLLSRIRSRGGRLMAVDVPMADHYTPYLSTLERIKLNFLPIFRGKKLYGAGQVVAARFKEKTLLQFIVCYPYPFLVFSGLVSAPFLFLLWPPLPLISNAAIAIWLGLTNKWYFYLVYLGNLLQIFRGLGRYNPFTPSYRKV